MSHIASVTSYLVIFGTLMVMTAITVAVSYVNLGELNKVVALGIASFKATLVILYFMHVKYSSRLTKLVVVSGFFFLIILLGLTMADYASREWLPVPPPLQ
jgi:cytochrome c oxidase subunit IV